MTSVPTRATGTKHVLVICQLDAYANGVKPVEIQRFLRQLGHDVRLVDTYHLSRSTRAPAPFGARLPALSPRRFALFATEAASVALTRRWGFGRRHLTYYLMVADHRLRRAILKRSLPLDAFDLVICETPYDAGVLAAADGARTLYDAPTPWADEVYFDGKVSERQHRKLRRLEVAICEDVDHLAFHWDPYARYAVDRYGISGRNLMSLNFGCTPSKQRAQFALPPRIVYFGNVSAGYNAPALLARLAALYPYIDVYGGPPPDPRLGLRYLGYTPSLDVLSDYQLGLVTCSRDRLRRNGFSAKHVSYLSYGLPVLVPSWRRHLDLLRGSVPYTEESFMSVVDSMRDERRWRKASDEAYAQAERLRWDETLRPLEQLLSRDPRLPEDRKWT